MQMGSESRFPRLDSPPRTQHPKPSASPSRSTKQTMAEFHVRWDHRAGASGPSPSAMFTKRGMRTSPTLKLDFEELSSVATPSVTRKSSGRLKKPSRRPVHHLPSILSTG